MNSKPVELKPVELISMVRATVAFRVEFRQQIRKFCFDNDIDIICCRDLGYYDNYTFDCEAYNIDKLMIFVEQLKKEWKKKGFWWRMWNFITYKDGIKTN